MLHFIFSDGEKNIEKDFKGGGGNINKARRKEINGAIKELNRIQTEIESLSTDITMICCDEQDYMDNIPENLQNSERYDKGEYVVENLEEATENIEEIIQSFKKVQTLLYAAVSV